MTAGRSRVNMVSRLKVNCRVSARFGVRVGIRVIIDRHVSLQNDELIGLA